MVNDSKKREQLSGSIFDAAEDDPRLAAVMEKMTAGKYDEIPPEDYVYAAAQGVRTSSNFIFSAFMNALEDDDVDLRSICAPASAISSLIGFAAMVVAFPTTANVDRLMTIFGEIKQMVEKMNVEAYAAAMAGLDLDSPTAKDLLRGADIATTPQEEAAVIKEVQTDKKIKWN